jgi:hypothetical protein
MRCEFCTNEIPEGHVFYRQVTAWKRSKGTKYAKPDYTGKAACWMCVEGRRQEIPGQLSIEDAS